MTGPQCGYREWDYNMFDILQITYKGKIWGVLSENLQTPATIVLPYISRIMAYLKMKEKKLLLNSYISYQAYLLHIV